MHEPQGKKWYKRWWAIIIYIFAGLLVLFIIVPVPETEEENWRKTVSRFRQGNPEMTEEERELLLDKNAPALGTTTEADITIVSFSCFTCPGAQQMSSTIREIGRKYEDHTNIIFRHFPTSENSLQYHLAAECAHEQKRFWPLYNGFFQSQKRLTPEAAFSLAENIEGMDADEFSECLMRDEPLQRVTEDAEQAVELGVQGSPTTYINGYKIEKPIPREVFISIIENIIEFDEDKK